MLFADKAEPLAMVHKHHHLGIKMALETQQNPHADRITEALARRAQPVDIDPSTIRGMGMAAAFGGGDVNTLLESIRQPELAQRDREYEQARSAYDLFEEQRAAGSREALAVDAALGQFTSDPTAKAQLIEYMHNLPDNIDTSNQTQILGAAARGMKELGLQTDVEIQRAEKARAQAAEDEMRALKMQVMRQDIAVGEEKLKQARAPKPTLSDLLPPTPPQESTQYQAVERDGFTQYVPKTKEGQGLDGAKAEFSQAEAVYRNAIASGDSGLIKQAEANYELSQNKLQREQQSHDQREVATKNLMGLQDDFADIEEFVNIAKEQSKTPTAAGSLRLGGYTPPAANLDATMDRINADAAFSRLQEMRDSSKTGGALGQISERELKLLGSARAALSVNQSDENLRRNLDKYLQVRRRALKNVAEAYKKDYGEHPPGFNPGTVGEGAQGDNDPLGIR